jgi:hypothetical protein
MKNIWKGLSGRGKLVALGLGATVLQLGPIAACDDQLTALTRYVDPCGTVLGNCNPGDFQTNNANPGDWCIDPACTVPGACADTPPLGAIRDICP